MAQIKIIRSGARNYHVTNYVCVNDVMVAKFSSTMDRDAEYRRATDMANALAYALASNVVLDDQRVGY